MADFKRVEVEMLFSIKEDFYIEGIHSPWVGSFRWRPDICSPEWEDNDQRTESERLWLKHEVVI